MGRQAAGWRDLKCKLPFPVDESILVDEVLVGLGVLAVEFHMGDKDMEGAWPRVDRTNKYLVERDADYVC